MKPIRILHVFGGLNLGGAESRTLDIYKNIDRSKIKFDFLLHTDEKGYYEKEVLNMGSKIYRIPRFSPNTVFNYYREVKNFFSEHNDYKIVHGHMLSTAFIYLREAKKNNIPIRIAHSRCGSRTDINFENLTKEFFKRLARFYVTDKMAVSKIAAKSAFGKQAVKNNDVTIFPNAIDVNKYVYNEKIREIKRKEFDLNDELVIGHVGRFAQQKNHKFILDIFSEVVKYKADAKLILVGDGDKKNEIEKLAFSKGLNNNIIFTGLRSDVPEILQAFDILLFPSLFEGLPGVVLEAQTAGLPCIISDKITKEVKLTNLVKYISLDKSASYWAEKLLGLTNEFSRGNMKNEIVKAGFDIRSVAEKYQSFYLNKINEL